MSYLVGNLDVAISGLIDLCLTPSPCVGDMGAGNKLHVYLSHMLVDEQNGNIFPFLREAVKGTFDGRVLRSVINDEIVLLRIRRFGDVLHARRVSALHV